MFHFSLFLLHRRFKETRFNLIRSSNRCNQTSFLFHSGVNNGESEAAIVRLRRCGPWREDLPSICGSGNTN